MHAQGHALLSAKGHATRVLFQEVAVRHSLTVDELVSAGLHRLPMTAERTAAVLDVDRVDSTAFEGLDAWPYTCAFCGYVHEVAERRECTSCGKGGCPLCVPARCPPCNAARRKQIEESRAIAAARDES